MCSGSSPVTLSPVTIPVSNWHSHDHSAHRWCSSPVLSGLRGQHFDMSMYLVARRIPRNYACKVPDLYRSVASVWVWLS